MDKPIYRIFLNRFRDAYYQLSPQEQNALSEEIDKVGAQLGIKFIAMYDTSWSTEQWDFGGIAEYPNLEAVIALKKWQDERNWFRYVDSFSILGTKYEAPS